MEIQKFYKYLSLAEVKNLGFLQTYLEQEIWLTPLKNFNDPFEGHFLLNPGSPEFIKKNIQASLNDKEKLLFILDCYQKNGEPDLTEQQLRERLSSSEFYETNLALEPLIIKDFFSNFGALCLTTKNDDIPMWAYYGDEHRGCCLEFELDFSYIEKNADITAERVEDFIKGVNDGIDILPFRLNDQPEFRFYFTRVIYSKIVPTFNMEEYAAISDRYEKDEYLIKNSMGVKYIEWAHEKEFRLLANISSEKAGLLPLHIYAPFIKITGIILGGYLEKYVEQYINSLCEKFEHINIYRASCLKTSYKIEIEQARTRK